MFTRIFAAAVFALLALTAPAHASIIEFVNLNFGNGYQEIGDLAFDPSPYPGGGYILEPLHGDIPSAVWLYFDGLRLPPTPPGCPCGSKPFPGFGFELSGGPPVDVFFSTGPLTVCRSPFRL
jgi:hypothetical protein